jgi:hypothetical protein
LRKSGVRALIKKPLEPAAFLAVLRGCLPQITQTLS